MSLGAGGLTVAALQLALNSDDSSIVRLGLQQFADQILSEHGVRALFGYYSLPSRDATLAAIERTQESTERSQETGKTPYTALQNISDATIQALWHPEVATGGCVGLLSQFLTASPQFDEFFILWELCGRRSEDVLLCHDHIRAFATMLFVLSGGEPSEVSLARSLAFRVLNNHVEQLTKYMEKRNRRLSAAALGLLIVCYRLTHVLPEEMFTYLLNHGIVGRKLIHFARIKSNDTEGQKNTEEEKMEVEESTPAPVVESAMEVDGTNEDSELQALELAAETDEWDPRALLTLLFFLIAESEDAAFLPRLLHEDKVFRHLAMDLPVSKPATAALFLQSTLLLIHRSSVARENLGNLLGGNYVIGRAIQMSSGGGDASASDKITSLLPGLERQLNIALDSTFTETSRRNREKKGTLSASIPYSSYLSEHMSTTWYEDVSMQSISLLEDWERVNSLRLVTTRSSLSTAADKALTASLFLSEIGLLIADTLLGTTIRLPETSAGRQFLSRRVVFPMVNFMLENLPVVGSEWRRELISLLVRANNSSLKKSVTSLRIPLVPPENRLQITPDVAVQLTHLCHILAVVPLDSNVTTHVTALSTGDSASLPALRALVSSTVSSWLPSTVSKKELTRLVTGGVLADLRVVVDVILVILCRARAQFLPALNAVHRVVFEQIVADVLSDLLPDFVSLYGIRGKFFEKLDLLRTKEIEEKMEETDDDGDLDLNWEGAGDTVATIVSRQGHALNEARQSAMDADRNVAVITISTYLASLAVYTQLVPSALGKTKTDLLRLLEDFLGTLNLADTNDTSSEKLLLELADLDASIVAALLEFFSCGTRAGLCAWFGRADDVAKSLNAVMVRADWSVAIRQTPLASLLSLAISLHSSAISTDSSELATRVFGFTYDVLLSSGLFRVAGHPDITLELQAEARQWSRVATKSVDTALTLVAALRFAVHFPKETTREMTRLSNILRSECDVSPIGLPFSSVFVTCLALARGQLGIFRPHLPAFIGAYIDALHRSPEEEAEFIASLPVPVEGEQPIKRGKTRDEALSFFEKFTTDFRKSISSSLQLAIVSLVPAGRDPQNYLTVLEKVINATPCLLGEFPNEFNLSFLNCQLKTQLSSISLSEDSLSSAIFAAANAIITKATAAVSSTAPQSKSERRKNGVKSPSAIYNASLSTIAEHWPVVATLAISNVAETINVLGEVCDWLLSCWRDLVSLPLPNFFGLFAKGISVPAPVGGVIDVMATLLLAIRHADVVFAAHPSSANELLYPSLNVETDAKLSPAEKRAARQWFAIWDYLCEVSVNLARQLAASTASEVALNHFLNSPIFSPSRVVSLDAFGAMLRRVIASLLSPASEVLSSSTTTVSHSGSSKSVPFLAWPGLVSAAGSSVMVSIDKETTKLTSASVLASLEKITRAMTTADESSSVDDSTTVLMAALVRRGLPSAHLLRRLCAVRLQTLVDVPESSSTVQKEKVIASVSSDPSAISALRVVNWNDLPGLVTKLQNIASSSSNPIDVSFASTAVNPQLQFINEYLRYFDATSLLPFSDTSSAAEDSADPVGWFGDLQVSYRQRHELLAAASSRTVDVEFAGIDTMVGASEEEHKWTSVQWQAIGDTINGLVAGTDEVDAVDAVVKLLLSSVELPPHTTSTTNGALAAIERVRMRRSRWVRNYFALLLADWRNANGQCSKSTPLLAMPLLCAHRDGPNIAPPLLLCSPVESMAGNNIRPPCAPPCACLATCMKPSLAIHAQAAVLGHTLRLSIRTLASLIRLSGGECEVQVLAEAEADACRQLRRVVNVLMAASTIPVLKSTMDTGLENAYPEAKAAIDIVRRRAGQWLRACLQVGLGHSAATAALQTFVRAFSTPKSTSTEPVVSLVSALFAPSNNAPHHPVSILRLSVTHSQWAPLLAAAIVPIKNGQDDEGDASLSEEVSSPMVVKAATILRLVIDVIMYTTVCLQNCSSEDDRTLLMEPLLSLQTSLRGVYTFSASLRDRLTLRALTILDTAKIGPSLISLSPPVIATNTITQVSSLAKSTSNTLDTSSWLAAIRPNRVNATLANFPWYRPLLPPAFVWEAPSAVNAAYDEYESTTRDVLRLWQGCEPQDDVTSPDGAIESPVRWIDDGSEGSSMAYDLCFILPRLASAIVAITPPPPPTPAYDAPPRHDGLPRRDAPHRHDGPRETSVPAPLNVVADNSPVLAVRPLVTSGVLALLMAALGSTCVRTRILALASLQRLHQWLSSSAAMNDATFRERPAVALLVTFLRDSIAATHEANASSTLPVVLPAAVSLFLARASFAAMQPRNELFTPVTRLLASRPVLDHCDVPLFDILTGVTASAHAGSSDNDCLQASATSVAAPVLTALRSLAPALSRQGHNDHANFSRRHGYARLAALLPLISGDTRAVTATFEALSAALSVPAAARYLVERFGAITWLGGVAVDAIQGTGAAPHAARAICLLRKLVAALAILDAAASAGSSNAARAGASSVGRAELAAVVNSILGRIVACPAALRSADLTSSIVLLLWESATHLVEQDASTSTPASRLAALIDTNSLAQFVALVHDTYSMGVVLLPSGVSASRASSLDLSALLLLALLPVHHSTEGSSSCCAVLTPSVRRQMAASLMHSSLSLLTENPSGFNGEKEVLVSLTPSGLGAAADTVTPSMSFFAAMAHRVTHTVDTALAAGADGLESAMQAAWRMYSGCQFTSNDPLPSGLGGEFVVQFTSVALARLAPPTNTKTASATVDRDELLSIVAWHSAVGILIQSHLKDALWKPSPTNSSSASSLVTIEALPCTVAAAPIMRRLSPSTVRGSLCALLASAPLASFVSDSRPSATGLRASVVRSLQFAESLASITMQLTASDVFSQINLLINSTNAFAPITQGVSSALQHALTSFISYISSSELQTALRSDDKSSSTQLGNKGFATYAASIFNLVHRLLNVISFMCSCVERRIVSIDVAAELNAQLPLIHAKIMSLTTSLGYYRLDHGLMPSPNQEISSVLLNTVDLINSDVIEKQITALYSLGKHPKNHTPLVLASVDHQESNSEVNAMEEEHLVSPEEPVEKDMTPANEEDTTPVMDTKTPVKENTSHTSEEAMSPPTRTPISRKRSSETQQEVHGKRWKPWNYQF